MAKRIGHRRTRYLAVPNPPPALAPEPEFDPNPAPAPEPELEPVPELEPAPALAPNPLLEPEPLLFPVPFDVDLRMVTFWARAGAEKPATAVTWVPTETFAALVADTVVETPKPWPA